MMPPSSGDEREFGDRICRLGDPRLRPALERLVGRQMRDICPNGFWNPGESHCAHFVSHILGLEFGCTCAELTSTDAGAGAGNVRVHEIFARCDQVGRWEVREQAGDCLIFVSKPTAFNAATRMLINIPNKHIGICCGSDVFHYSSRHDAVLKKTVDQFLTYFEQAYSGQQALYFGTIA